MASVVILVVEQVGVAFPKREGQPQVRIDPNRKRVCATGIPLVLGGALPRDTAPPCHAPPPALCAPRLAASSVGNHRDHPP